MQLQLHLTLTLTLVSLFRLPAMLTWILVPSITERCWHGNAMIPYPWPSVLAVNVAVDYWACVVLTPCLFYRQKVTRLKCYPKTALWTHLSLEISRRNALWVFVLHCASVCMDRDLVVNSQYDSADRNYLWSRGVFLACWFVKYRINTENGCIWLEADVRGIYPTYLIVEEVSKTISWNHKFKGCICIHPLNLLFQLFSRDLWDIHPAKE